MKKRILPQRFLRERSPVSQKKRPNLSERKLIHRKFLTSKTLVIVVLISVTYLFFFTFLLGKLPSYVIAIAVLPSLFIVLHIVYQIVCDVKLLFQHDKKYDIDIDVPIHGKFPAVSFVIPSYQEPFSVAKLTFDSVVNVPYSGVKEIIVVDNSADTSSEDYLNWKAYVEDFYLRFDGNNITAKFISNESRKTLNPGNLDLAQQAIEKGKFVVFLDVDSTLPGNGDLLDRAVTEFDADAKLGFIQFRIRATNRHFNELTQAVASSQDLLRIRMVNRGYGGYKIFEGHNGIWRKSVLDVAGPWTDYHRGSIIITEDILKSAQMYSKHFYGKPLNIETGEWVPSSLKALEGMWMRWMYGNSQVFSKCFREIYSKHTTFVEKWDITCHILHHYVTACFFLVVFLLQLAVPGHAANLFILSMWLFPQLIAGATSYVSCAAQTNSIAKKLQYTYTAFFLIDTFIAYTRLKSNVKFALGVPQGWKVTEKGFENVMGWRSLFANNSFYMIMIVLTTALCGVSWMVSNNMKLESLIQYIGVLFMNVNLLVCTIYFAKQGRKPYNDVASAGIDDGSSEKVMTKKSAEVEVFSQ